MNNKSTNRKLQRTIAETPSENQRNYLYQWYKNEQVPENNFA